MRFMHEPYQYGEDGSFVPMKTTPFDNCPAGYNWDKYLAESGWEEQASTHDSGLLNVKIYCHAQLGLYYFDLLFPTRTFMQVFCKSSVAALHFLQKHVIPLTAPGQQIK